MKKTILTFDVDGSWVKEKNFKIKIEKPIKNDYVLEKGIPKVLDLLKKYNIKGTFFIVGKNLEIYPDLHKKIKVLGNEIASHTYSHPFPFDECTLKEKEDEIKKNDELIKKILNIKPIGFRAPAYRIDDETISILEKEKYEYDSSIVPTYFPGHFKFKNIFAPKGPYYIEKNFLKKGERNIIEVPLASVGFFPLIGTVLTNFGINYLKFFSKIILNSNRPLILNFHIRDLVNIERNSFWLRSLKKRERVINEVLSYLNKRTEFVTMEQFIHEIKSKN